MNVKSFLDLCFIHDYTKRPCAKELIQHVLFKTEFGTPNNHLKNSYTPKYSKYSDKKIINICNNTIRASDESPMFSVNITCKSEIKEKIDNNEDHLNLSQDSENSYNLINKEIQKENINLHLPVQETVILESEKFDKFNNNYYGKVLNLKES